MIVDVSFRFAPFQTDYRGKVIQTTQTVELFDGKPMQVPALLIEKSGSREIVVQPLVADGYSVVVKRMSMTKKEEEGDKE